MSTVRAVQRRSWGTFFVLVTITSACSDTPTEAPDTVPAPEVAADIADPALCPALGLCDPTPEPGLQALHSMLATAPSAAPWAEGYVFAGVWDRQYQIFDNSGGFVDYIPAPSLQQNYTAGCAFNRDETKLYSAFFGASDVRVYDAAGSHGEVQRILADVGSHAESIDFDAAGDFFYVGQPDGSRKILKYSAAGVRVAQYSVQVEGRGADWIDLAADDRTIFYTSEGRRILRYDVVEQVQLTDFAVLPDRPTGGAGGPAFALRLLPPFDGSGGLIVADRWDIKRLDGGGSIVWTADFGSENGWFAMNLDPDGEHFWAGGTGSGDFYKFRISDGAWVAGPFESVSAGRVGLWGLCLLGEPGGNEPPVADAGGPYLGAAGALINLDGSGSSDPDGDPLTYEWELGADGQFDDGLGIHPVATFPTADIYPICVRVTDTAGASDVDCDALVVVYDPGAGFVTGGGWIDSPAGAYRPDDALSGKASFGFVSKYKKGTSVPDGSTEFQFHAAGLDFHSNSYDWLVVTGSDYARYKGVGTVNGSTCPVADGDGPFRFMLWAGDGEPDTFRIRIWCESESGTETEFYDNGFDQGIGGGSIVIHASKQ